MSDFAHSGDLNFGINWWCSSTGMSGGASGMGTHQDYKAPVLEFPAPAHDPITRAAHYNQGDIECIDALAAALGTEGVCAYLRGTAMAYLWRAGRKGDAVEDLRKARWNLDKEISLRTGGAA